MIDKFSQVAENLPAADRDADRQYHVINGYPVVFSFSKEPNPEAFMKQLEEAPQLMESFTQKFVEQYGEHILAQLAKKMTKA